MRPPARIVLAASAAALAAVGLTACTQPSPLPSLSSTPSPSPTRTPLSVAKIAGLAVQEVGDGTVVSVHDEALGTLWDVIVVQQDGGEQELHLDRSGRVVAGPSADPTSADDASANRGRVAAASIGLSGAVDRMASAVPGGRVTAIVLTDYQDRVVWRGDVLASSGIRHDVVIDAVNGSVLADLADQRQGSSPSPTSIATSPATTPPSISSGS